MQRTVAGTWSRHPHVLADFFFVFILNKKCIKTNELLSWNLKCINIESRSFYLVALGGCHDRLELTVML